jgi:DNA polymerase III gamma/tau subunit
MAFCKKTGSKIKHALQQFDAFIEQHSEEALRVTKIIKAALESPLVDLLEAIIPGDADTIFKNKVLQALETGIDTLNIVNTCRNEPNLEAKLICFVTALKEVSTDLQDAVLQKLQSILLRELDGNAKKQNIYDLFSQAAYSNSK